MVLLFVVVVVPVNDVKFSLLELSNNLFGVGSFFVAKKILPTNIGKYMATSGKLLPMYSLCRKYTGYAFQECVNSCWELNYRECVVNPPYPTVL